MSLMIYDKSSFNMFSGATKKVSGVSRNLLKQCKSKSMLKFSILSEKKPKKWSHISKYDFILS